MTTAIGSEADLATVRSDLAALKSDVGSLIEQIKAGARNNSRRRRSNQRSVRGLSHGAAAEGKRSVKSIGACAEEQPLMAVLIALSIGYVGVRAILR